MKHSGIRSEIYVIITTIKNLNICPARKIGILLNKPDPDDATSHLISVIQNCLEMLPYREQEQ